MKEQLVKHKKALIMISILIAAAVTVSVFSIQTKVRKEEMLVTMTTLETAQVERRTLVESISATGTVTSIGIMDRNIIGARRGNQSNDNL